MNVHTSTRSISRTGLSAWRANLTASVGLSLVLVASVSAQVAGRTPGATAVSATGVANYSIPIWTPPGAGGMQPQIALQYSHTAPNSIVGAGFSFSGLPSISRCVKTIAQDGAASAPNLLADDAFCLDGVRLRLEGGTYGADGSTYRTEIDTYARITAKSASGVGPSWFEVRSRDGMIYEYGNSTSSKILVSQSTSVRTWALSSARDRAGNTIEFRWINDALNGSFRPDEFLYATNAAASVTTAPYSLKFIYEPAARVDPQYGYAVGTRVAELARLARLEVRFNGAAVKQYLFTYEAGAATGESRLKYLQECATSTTTCLARTEFTYQDGATGWPTAATSSTLVSANPATSSLADFNQDGRDDLVYVGTDGLVRYSLALSSGGFAASVTTSAPAGAVPTLVRPIEWNGDGLRDIGLLYPTYAPFVGLVGYAVRVLVNTGGAFTLVDPAASVSGRVADWADVSGDGRDDLLFGGYTSQIVQVRLNSGGALAVATNYWTPPNLEILQEFSSGAGGGLNGGRRLVDLNGDGSTDLVLRTCTQGTSPCVWRVLRSQANVGTQVGTFSSTAKPLVGDVDGDGLTDFVYVTTAALPNMLAHRFGTGTGLSSQVLNSGPIIVSAFDQAAIADWDGDGNSDLVFPSGTQWAVARSNGATFNAPVNLGITYASTQVARVGDFSGDALGDLALITATTLASRVHGANVPDLLVSATDGYGVKSTFVYGSLADAAVYTRGTGTIYPNVDVTAPRVVVKELRLTDGTATGSEYPISFRYEAARQNLAGRGFLGFAKRISTDQSLAYNQVTEQTFDQVFPFIGAETSATLKQSNGTVIGLTVSSWLQLPAGAGVTARAYPYVSSSTTEIREVGGTFNGTAHTRVQRQVNAIEAVSGLQTDVTTTVTELATGLATNASKSTRVYHSSVFNDTGNWCIGRPQTTQLIASHTLTTGTQVSRTFESTWTGETGDGTRCRPTQQRIEPGSSTMQVTVGLRYDSFGNLDQRTVTGVNMTPRVTNVNWGTRGVSPETITNPLSQPSQMTWDYGLGVPLTSRDPNLLQTQWEYDAFGRITLEKTPDNARRRWAYSAYTGGDTRTKLVVDESLRNTSDVVVRSRTRYLDRFDRLAYDLLQTSSGSYSIVSMRTWDPRGRVIQTFNPQWNGGPGTGYWQMSYDQVNRPTLAQLMTPSASENRRISYAYNGLAQSVTDPRTNTTTRTATAWGDVIRVRDAANGDTSHLFDAFGNLKQVTDPANNLVTSVNYNVRGFRTGLTDMDLGAWTFTPNALGEVASQLDAKNQTTLFSYDLVGRLTTRQEPDLTSNWIWGTNAAAFNIGQLESINTAGAGYSESYSYNSAGQLASRTVTSDQAYTFDLQYNDFGALHAMTYPTSTASVRLKLLHAYSFGYLTEVRDFTGDIAGTVYWRLNGIDPRANPTQEALGNGVNVVSSYLDLTGELLTRQSGTAATPSGLQNLEYSWDLAGNLQSRRDLRVTPNLFEQTFHDALNRFDYSTLNGVALDGLNVDYNAIGNITFKSDVGSYVYDATRKHAVITAGALSLGYDANGNMSSGFGGTASWYASNLPNLIQGPSNLGPTSSQFWYGPERNRWRQVMNVAGVTETTMYVGGLLEKSTQSGVTTWKHFVGGYDGGVAAVVRKSDGTNSVIYLTKDHLGSVDSISDPSANVLVRLSFDPFGGRRNPTTWKGPPPGSDFTLINGTTDRGFTMHEGIDNLSLVHMNGRVYRPQIGRFISADPFISDVEASQELNRYSYVGNNPLRFTDPSGFEACNTCPNPGYVPPFPPPGTFPPPRTPNLPPQFPGVFPTVPSPGVQGDPGALNVPSNLVTATQGQVRSEYYQAASLLNAVIWQNASPQPSRWELMRQRFANLRSGFIRKTDAEVEAWGRGLKEAEKTGRPGAVGDYLRANPPFEATSALIEAAAGGAAFGALRSAGSGSFSRIVPGGGLAAHEAVGGHLLARHVGRTQVQLADRLATQPGISAASAFGSRAEAEAAVSAVLDANALQVSAWVASGANGRLVLEGAFQGGAVLSRGAASIVEGNAVRVVLQGTQGGNYFILTGFPIP